MLVEDVVFGNSYRITLPGDLDAEVSLRLPDGSTEGPFSTTVVDGEPVYDYLPATSGLYVWRAVAAGTEDVAAEGSFYVWPAYGADLPVPWTPTLYDVGALVPTRTLDSAGVQQDTFTDQTTPTDEQVEGYITRIIAEVHGVVPDIPAGVFEQAKHTVTLGVAWLVERSFPPTAEVQNLGNDFASDYRASLRSLARSARVEGRGDRAAFSIRPSQPCYDETAYLLDLLNGRDPACPTY